MKWLFAMGFLSRNRKFNVLTTQYADNKSQNAAHQGPLNMIGNNLNLMTGEALIDAVIDEHHFGLQCTDLSKFR